MRALEDFCCFACEKAWLLSQEHERFRIKEKLEEILGQQNNCCSESSPRVKAIIALIVRGATEGERLAARAAYKRIMGREYI